eukprot:8666673-Pyramimonas_sp.AAC.1
MEKEADAGASMIESCDASSAAGSGGRAPMPAQLAACAHMSIGHELYIKASGLAHAQTASTSARRKLWA